MVASEGEGVAVAPGAGQPRLPALWRVPNPPRPFVGRGPCVEKVVAALEVGPLVLITGEAGVGKSALALHAVAAASDKLGLIPARRARVQGGAWVVEPLEQQLRRLLAWGELVAPDWRVLDADPGAAWDALVELAERGGWCVLIDDADAFATHELEQLVHAVVRWCSRSRWLITQRAVGAAMAGLAPVVRVGALGAAAQRAWLREVGLTDGEVDALVTEGGGVPAVLAAALASRVAPSGEGGEDAWADLALLKRPLRPDVLARVGIDVGAPAIQGGVAAGRVRVLPEGYVVLRSFGRPVDIVGAAGNEAGSAGRRSALAQRLSAAEDEGALLEALRLWLELGRDAEALALLERWGEVLCERGCAAELWSLLRGCDGALGRDVALEDWLQWAAWEWGSPEVDAAISRCDAPRWRPLILRARVALNRGRFPEAVVLAQRAYAVADTPVQRDRALLRAARALYSLGRPEDTLALIGLCSSQEGGVLVESAVLRAECLALTPEGAEAARVVEELLDHLPRLASGLRVRAYLGIARVHLLRQRLRDGERIITSLLQVGAARVQDSVLMRTALELAAYVAVNRADFGTLRSLVARLSGPGVSETRRLFLQSYEAVAAEWQESAGSYSARVRTLVDASSEAGEGMAQDVRVYADVLLLRDQMRRGLEPRVLAPGDMAAPTGLLGLARGAVLARAQAAWGGAVVLPEVGETGWQELRVLVGLAGATLALHEGLRHGCPDAIERADAAAGRVERLASEVGLELHQVDAALLRVWVALARGSTEEAAPTLHVLEEAARRWQAPRLAEEHSLLAAMLGPRSPAGVLLDAWACASEGHPRVARWARWLLGEDVPLSPLERLLLERCVERPGWARARLVQSAAGAAEERALVFGWDERSALLWQVSGVGVDLSEVPTQAAVLGALVRAGGSLDKEGLLREAWGVTSYHPLRHDNRLRVTVRKLRVACKGSGVEDPLAADAEGYRLRGRWRWFAAERGALEA